MVVPIKVRAAKKGVEFLTRVTLIKKYTGKKVIFNKTELNNQAHH